MIQPILYAPDESFVGTMRQFSYVDFLGTKYPSLNVIHHRLFLLCCSQPGISMKEAEIRLNMDRNNSSRTVARLCEPTKQTPSGLGLLSAVPDEDDRRVKLLYPTQKGINALKEMSAEFDRLIQSKQD